ncbi:MAG: M20/M25/M40 family metallo-hydrolase [Cyclobacteriaceae bacterium]
MRFYFLFAILLTGLSANAQNLSTKRIQQLSDEQLPTAIKEFRSFLSIPNDGHFDDHVVPNIVWCRQAFSDLGFDLFTIEAKKADMLLATKQIDPKKKTVLFYLQIDGQPADTAAWDQLSPYEPALKKAVGDDWQAVDWDELKNQINLDYRIFARSASDSKGPAMALIQALKIMDEQKFSPAFNVKVIMDFQEELGSPELPGAVARYKEELQADFLVIMDGVRSVINEPTLTFGARGMSTITLKIYGPKEPQHSGQFGNFAPNPVFKATQLIAGMKDENGKVIIPGFYDGVSLSDEEKAILATVPDDQQDILNTLGIAKADAVGSTYQEALQYPSLNIRGMQAAWVGKEVRTIIPSEVIIEIDMRLVPETPGQRQVDLVKKYIQDQGFHLIEGEPTEEERSRYEKLAGFKYRLGSVPFRTDYGTPMDKWLTSAITRATGKAPIRMRTTGGSQPIGPFVNTLNVPAISVRIPNPGSNIHAPNENIRIGNFLEGIQTCLGILTESIK